MIFKKLKKIMKFPKKAYNNNYLKWKDDQRVFLLKIIIILMKIFVLIFQIAIYKIINFLIKKKKLIYINKK